MPSQSPTSFHWPVTSQSGAFLGTVNVTLVNHNNGQEVGVKADFGLNTSLPIPHGLNRLEAAAKLCGGDHFNWYHVCLDDTNPTHDWVGNITKIPYIDPPAYGFGPTATGRTDVQWGDRRPWYFDETLPPTEVDSHGKTIFKYGYNAQENYIGCVSDVNTGVPFIDHPMIERGHKIAFKGWLVCVKTDGTAAAWLGGFGWDSRTDLNGKRKASLTGQFSGGPSKQEYDDLIGANPYMWNHDHVKINFNLTL